LAAISWITVHIHTTIIQRIHNMTKVTRVTKSLKSADITVTDRTKAI